jgi:hypothetical protein
MEDSVITLIKDNVEFIVEKFQEIGEETVCIAVVQRENIMAKLIEVYENLQQLRSQEGPQVTTQQQEKTQQPPMHKEGEKTI